MNESGMTKYPNHGLLEDPISQTAIFVAKHVNLLYSHLLGFSIWSQIIYNGLFIWDNHIITKLCDLLQIIMIHLIYPKMSICLQNFIYRTLELLHQTLYNLYKVSLQEKHLAHNMSQLHNLVQINTYSARKFILSFYIRLTLVLNKI